ncbi:MAG TPA: glycogen debranching N-terminal domain-containing protein [Gemmatimonadaceae bacterium]|nr:glycogen debranching N-terminal domain-containing protein [Gemmatimonadaceae bacterium]
MAKQGGRSDSTKATTGKNSASTPPLDTGHRPRTHGERQERKRRVLTHGTSSITPSISAALVAKNGNLYFLCERDGRVPMEGAHGFGLYYHDCRFLDGYEMAVGNARPTELVATAARDHTIRLELTNPDMHAPDGQLIPKESLGITWERVVDGRDLILHDRITFENYGREHAEFPVSLSMRSRFQDIFIVRGMLGKKTGSTERPAWRDGALQLVYRGEDSLYRSTTIFFEPAPPKSSDGSAAFTVRLKPREAWVLDVFIEVRESARRSDVVELTRPLHPDSDDIVRSLREETKHWLSQHTRIASDSLVLRRLVTRSLRDLEMLRTCLSGDHFFAAGVPWFTTLFGRDSIITSLQTLMFNRAIAEQTLRMLAKYQGEKVDEWRDEQPGRILHELRVGELAHAGAIPHTPYYGTIDATPLFLILLGEHAKWSGTLELFDELRDNAERALAWMSDHGDPDGDGYLEYESSSAAGLINQGWKDSGDAIIDANGALARPPIALVEVQGYKWMALNSMATLFRRAGDSGRANELERRARELRTRFNEDFWMEDEGCYALALQGDKSQAAVVGSNAGQALWTGISDPDKAKRTARRLMAEDMFNGWGIRTLASSEARYNPIGYHLGTVWPHDNSIIAAGLRRYGLDENASAIFESISDAATTFDNYRLPELFAGFPRRRFGVPVHYPVACHPQAWAAGSIPFLLQTLLGIHAEAFEHRLRVVRPMLPELAHHVILRGLRVGDAATDLRFQRTSHGVAVDVLSIEGELNVLLEPNEARQPA